MVVNKNEKKKKTLLPCYEFSRNNDQIINNKHDVCRCEFLRWVWELYFFAQLLMVFYFGTWLFLGIMKSADAKQFYMFVVRECRQNSRFFLLMIQSNFSASILQGDDSQRKIIIKDIAENYINHTFDDKGPKSFIFVLTAKIVI